MKIKSLFAVALFNFLVVASAEELVVASAEDESGRAPKATASDAETSFWDMPYLEKAFIDTSPENRNDNIPVGELGIDGGNKDAIVKLAEEIAIKKHGLYDLSLIHI